MMGLLPSPAYFTQATATVAPGDVIALTATDVQPVAVADAQQTGEVRSTAFWVYGQTIGGNSDWDEATIVSSASAGTSGGVPLTAVSIQLPSTLPAHSIYLLYEVNGTSDSSTYSVPYVINQPQVWWTDQNNAYVGGKVSVFGTNLSYGVSLQPYSDQSWVYLFPETSGSVPAGTVPIILPVSAVAPDPVDGSGAMDVNAYKVDFDLPASVAARSYQVEIYNGHGGVYGLSSPTSASVINVVAAPTPTVMTLAAAYSAADSSSGGTDAPLWIQSEGFLNPVAISETTAWAFGQCQYGTYSFVSIQMPAGTIQIDDSADELEIYPFVQLIGAGDTGNGTTGTLIEGTGSNLSYLVNFDGSSYGGLNFHRMLSHMYIMSNGSIASGGTAIEDVGGDIGVTLEDVTVDATTDVPSNPGSVSDYYGDGGSNYKFSDCTFIGEGASVDGITGMSFDNCHFIGCGPTVAQISSGVSQPDADLSVTRCTDQSLVNNITSPGGNVEYDGAARLIWSDSARGNIYIANDSTNDLYISLPDNGNGGGGAEIELEDGGGAPPNHNIVICDNTLSGDGMESVQDGDSGIETGASNLIITDNDISNVCNAIYTWNSGDRGIVQNFGMFSDNSIHNITCGISALFAEPSVSTGTPPQGLGNSYNGNLINGIIGDGAAILLSPYVPDNNPQTVMMNIFYNDIVTGAAIGFQWAAGAAIQNGPAVLANCYFSSDGSDASTLITLYSGHYDPLVDTGISSQGFWSSIKILNP